MMTWCFRCVYRLFCALVALVGLVAVAEVGLRIHRLNEHLESPANATAVTALADIPSSVTGWELPPLASGKIALPSGGTREVRTNSMGLRGPEVVSPKPAGVYRIVCLGGEAILARELADEALLTSQMQTLLQQQTQYRIEVVNAAIPLGGPLTATIHQRRLAQLLQADLVLMHLRPQNVMDDARLRRWTVRDRQGIPLACIHPERRRRKADNVLNECRQEFALINLALETWAASNLEPEAGSAAEREEASWNAGLIAETLQPLETLSETCTASYARLLLWMAPASPRDRKHFDEFQAAAQPWLTDHKLAFADASPALRAADTLAADSDGWTEEGHRQLASFLTEGLTRHVPGPWSSPYTAPHVLPAAHQAISPPARSLSNPSAAHTGAASQPTQYPGQPIRPLRQ